MKNKWKILIVDDDLSILRSYQKYLESEGYTVFTADDGRNGYISIEKEHPDLVLLDINMPVKTGLELLEDLNRTFSKKDIPLIVMLTAFGDLDAAVKAMNLGAYEFLTKPVPLEKLRSTVECALETLTLKERVAYFIEPDNTPFKDTIIGRDPLMVDIYKTIGTLKGNKATILVTGESGTGKEMVAKAIHENTVPNEPCIAINCAAVPENLIESELMGYVKGAFTGANANREGKLEAVRGGTLVLDEISEMPYEFQTKLLRVIQEKDFYPIGATEKKAFQRKNRCFNEQKSEGTCRKREVQRGSFLPPECHYDFRAAAERPHKRPRNAYPALHKKGQFYKSHRDPEHNQRGGRLSQIAYLAGKYPRARKHDPARFDKGEGQNPDTRQLFFSCCREKRADRCQNEAEYRGRFYRSGEADTFARCRKKLHRIRS